MLRRTVPLQVNPSLGDREVEIVMMTGGLKDDGFDLDPAGVDLDRYLANPIQLWQHNPEHPVATNDNLRIVGDGIAAHTTFAPAGISAKADEICGLVKAGIIRACSIGFEVLERIAVDVRDPRKGWRVLKWALLECSFVSVPLDTAAVVTARAGGDEMATWKCGAKRGFAIQDGDPAWDGSAAEAAIFRWAGGDEFDPAKARQCFLAYDADAPENRGSYKLPFVNIVDGDPVVPKSALRAASGAHGIAAADIGDAKDAAQRVLDAYKKKAGVGQDDEGDAAERTRRELVKRGMYGIAQLAYILDQVAYAKDCATYEAACEGDASRVPAMIGEGLVALGNALVAMTEEEVAELLAGDDDDDGIIYLDADEIRAIEAIRSPHRRAFLRGMFGARAALTAKRAGKALSAANAARIGEAEGHHARAMDHHRAATDSHASMGGHLDGLRDAVDTMATAISAGGEGESRARRLARAADASTTAQNHLEAMTDEHESIGDAQRGIARSIRGASRCLRAVDGYEGEGAMEGAEGSSGETTGASRAAVLANSDLDRRQRQAEALRLAVM